MKQLYLIKKANNLTTYAFFTLIFLFRVNVIEAQSCIVNVGLKQNTCVNDIVRHLDGLSGASFNQVTNCGKFLDYQFLINSPVIDNPSNNRCYTR